MIFNNQIEFWNRVANQKTFTHPINIPLLERFVSKNSYVVDYGCGYGRIVCELNEAGYNNVQGFDIAVELINRGNRRGVENIFQVDLPCGLPYEDNSVDCFLLFAVLTCIPDNQSQMEIMEVLHSKLRKNGIIYVSDYYLQNNSTELDYYEYLNGDRNNFGVFSLSEGVTFRHHTQEWIKYLLKNFNVLEERFIEVNTMNGNSAEAFQLLAVK